jgi:hypothetical protein
VFEQKITQEFEDKNEKGADADQQLSVEEGGVLRTGNRRRH